jgi:hypothetical protein
MELYAGKTLNTKISSNLKGFWGNFKAQIMLNGKIWRFRTPLIMRTVSKRFHFSQVWSSSVLYSRIILESWIKWCSFFLWFYHWKALAEFLKPYCEQDEKEDGGSLGAWECVKCSSQFAKERKSYDPRFGKIHHGLRLQKADGSWNPWRLKASWFKQHQLFTLTHHLSGN